MPRLVLLQGGESTPFELSQPETVVGRHPECDVQLPSNMVSRRHAKVSLDGGDARIEDLGSGNGTFVNGQRIDGSTALKHEDRIKLGPVLLRFEGEPAGRPAPQPSQTLVAEPDVFEFDVSASDAEVKLEETTRGFGMLDVQPQAKLQAIIEISRSLAGTLDVRTLLPRILDTLFEIFPHADRGSILLVDDATGRMVPAAQKHRRDDEDATVRMSRTILNKVVEEKSGILSADASQEFEASESIANLSIRSMMCVPLLSLDDEPVGLINIDTQNPINKFKKEDLDLLQAVASQAALSVETARLLQSYVEKQKQDNEMKIASDVQQALLPDVLPQVDGYQLYASYDSAQAVGGDYYDCMLLGDNLLCVSFGDVAGKGVPGAIIMSRMASCVQNTMSFCHDAGQAVAAINNHMCANAVEGRFVTYVLGLVDLETHALTLVNAGHMSPIIRKPDGSIEEFDDDTIGLPIGVVEDYPFDVVSRQLEPGETIVLFTDGVDEAMNPEGELYTLERLRDFVRNGSPNAEELGKAILADVRRHANGRPQNDDITIMTFGRAPA